MLRLSVVVVNCYPPAREVDEDRFSISPKPDGPLEPDNNYVPGEIKIILLGDSAVGKSKLIERFLMNAYTKHTASTYAVNIFSYKWTDPASEKTYAIDFWDTAGQEQFTNLHPSRRVRRVLRQVHCCMVPVSDGTCGQHVEQVATFCISDFAGPHGSDLSQTRIKTVWKHHLVLHHAVILRVDRHVYDHPTAISSCTLPKRPTMYVPQATITTPIVAFWHSM